MEKVIMILLICSLALSCSETESKNITIAGDYDGRSYTYSMNSTEIINSKCSITRRDNVTSNLTITVEEGLTSFGLKEVKFELDMKGESNFFIHPIDIGNSTYEATGSIQDDQLTIEFFDELDEQVDVFFVGYKTN